MAITILDLAIFRGAKPTEDGNYSGAELARVGLAIVGGCAVCGATLAAYNACPTQGGAWACSSGDCVERAEGGWESVAAANAAIFGDEPATISALEAFVIDARAWLEAHRNNADCGITSPETLEDLYERATALLAQQSPVQSSPAAPLSCADVVARTTCPTCKTPGVAGYLRLIESRDMTFDVTVMRPTRDVAEVIVDGRQRTYADDGDRRRFACHAPTAKDGMRCLTEWPVDPRLSLEWE